jgi:hypothetical protein
MRSDLQRPAVSMVLFSVILAGESAMNSLIASSYADDWQTYLSEGRRTKLAEVYEKRRQHKTDISPLECLMLEDRLTLVAKRPTLRQSLGFTTRDSFESWNTKLKRVRDVLAHGGGLLDAEEDPVRAIQLFNDVRWFAEECWKQASVKMSSQG